MLRCYFALVVVLVCHLSFAFSSSCTADFQIYTQPPNWPTGLNANLNVHVDNSASLHGWKINFTAKGYGPAAPFKISSFWNAGQATYVDNGDNTYTYTITDAGYNQQMPTSIGFLADTTLPHPRNAICGLSINNIPCTVSVSPSVSSPSIPSEAILLSYTYHNPADTSLPLLVLVHGITEDRRTWDPLVPLFTPYYRVIALDLRGHGLSPVTVGTDGYSPETMAADVYKTLVSAVGTNDLPLMVGHSLGGTIVTVYGHAYPVRGIIDIDQSMDLLSFQVSILSIASYLEADQATFEATIDALFDSLYGALNQSEIARVNAIRHPVQSVVLGVWAPLLDLTPDELSALTESVLQTPGGTSELALFGSDDGTDYESWFSARVPGAKTEYWTELPSHYPHLIFPYRFVQRVRDFDAVATQHLCL